MTTDTAALDGKPTLGDTPRRRIRLWTTLSWAAVLTISCAIDISIQLDSSGQPDPPWAPYVWELSSHLTVAALLPAIYWLDRRFPPLARRGNLLIQLAAVTPYSIAHTLGMMLGSLAGFTLLHAPFHHRGWLGQMGYELRKDVLNYTLILAIIYLIRHLLQMGRPVPPPAERDTPEPMLAASTASPEREPKRFAVRRDGREILVPIADVARFEAAGNYVILHTPDGRHDVRTTLTVLERELDPAEFVRVHRSSIVRLDQIREIQPWASGDFRLILRDGSQVNLSRRYRERLDKLILARG